MLKPIARETLCDRVTEQLLAHITNNLEPGDQLPSVAVISEEFGVSRAVVREAFQSLSTQFAIEVVSGKGAFVTAVDDRPLRLFFRRVVQTDIGTVPELMEVRKPIEMQSAALAAERRTEAELPPMYQLLTAMSENLTDLEVYADLDVEFHLSIAKASRNSILTHLIGSIRDSLREGILQGLRVRDSDAALLRVQELHAAVYERIAAGDAAGAADAMALHFDEAVTALVARPAGE